MSFFKKRKKKKEKKKKRKKKRRKCYLLLNHAKRFPWMSNIVLSDGLYHSRSWKGFSV